MNKVIAFILGMVFGIIIILGAIAGVLYYGGVILTPAKVSESTRDYIGDLADLSLYDMYKLAKKLYTEKAGQMVDDKYYSLGDFMTDNNINLDAALGFEIPQSVKDIPLLEYFNGQNGLQNALGQIKVSVLPDIVNLFTTTDEAGNKIVNQSAIDKLSNYSVTDLMGKNGIVEVFAEVTLCELLPQTFPQTKSETNQIMYALGQTQIGKAVNAFMSGGTNLYLELKDPKPGTTTPGALAELGKITFTSLVGSGDATLNAVLEGKTIADIIDDSGNITTDPVINDLQIGRLLGLTYNEETDTWTKSDGTPADSMYAAIAGITVGQVLKGQGINDICLGDLLGFVRNKITDVSAYTESFVFTDEQGNTTLTVLRNPATDAYVLAAPAKEGEQLVWYEAEFFCADETAHTSTHSKDCYKFVWYTDDTLATVATGVTGKLANTKISNLSNLNDEIQNFTLADVLGEDGVPQMLDSLKHTKIKDMETALDETYLGGFFKYYRKAVNQSAFSDTETDGIKVNGGVIAKADGDNYYIAKLICEQTHTHTASCYGFEWYTDSACSVLATGITAKLADEQVKNLGNLQDKIMTFTLKDVMGDDVPSVLKSIQDTKLSDLNGAIDQMYLGDMLGNHRVEVDDLTGYADVISGTVKQKGSLYAKIDSDAWYEADIVCDETHTHTADCFDYNWYDETDAKLDGVIASVASVKVGDMDGDTITAKVNNMKLGEVLTINSSSPQILQTLKDTRIGKLSDKVDTLTLGDVITIDGSSSTLLQNLKDKQITNLSLEIDNLTIDKVIDIGDSSPQILQTLKTKGTKISELGTAMNDLTIGDVVDVDAPGTSKILVELSDKKVDELGTAINGLYLGTAMNYNRKEITDISSYGITVCADVVSDGTRYARLYNGMYYQATYDCSQPHTHTAECYGFVWYTDEACTTTVSGVTAAFVNSKMDNISATIDNLTLAKLGIGAGNNLLMAVQDVPINDLGTALNKLDMGVMFVYKRMQVTGSYNIVVGNVYKNNNDANSFATMIDATLYLTHLECHDATHTATTHTEECFNVVWFEVCDAADAEYTGADGIDADNPTQGYRAVKGIYAKLSNKSLTDMSGGNGLQDVVETLTIGDFIASGMLTMSDEQQYKLDVMFEGGEHSFTENGFTYEISLSGYFQYKATHSAATAKDFFNKATHDEDCRYKWHELTLDQFLSTLLNAI